jgi:hypothetical protein
VSKVLITQQARKGKPDALLLKALSMEQHRQSKADQPPEDPEGLRKSLKAQWETTPADLQHMLGKERYPSWVHAAYADLAGRMMRLEEAMRELQDSMSLLHTKMEMLIMQRAIEERGEEPTDELASDP